MTLMLSLLFTLSGCDKPHEEYASIDDFVDISDLLDSYVEFEPEKKDNYIEELKEKRDHVYL